MLVYFAIYIYRTFLEIKVLEGAAIYKYLNIHLWGMPLEIAWVYHYYTCSSGTLMQAPRAYKVWMRGLLKRCGIISPLCKQNREDLAPQSGQNCLMQDNPHNIYTWKFTMWSVHQRSLAWINGPDIYVHEATSTQIRLQTHTKTVQIDQVYE